MTPRYALAKLYKEIAVGDKVTTNTPREVFGSNYAGRGLVEMAPGEIGTVAAVRSPNVRYSEAYKDEAVVVDFEKDGRMERVRLWYQHIVKVG